MNNQSLVQTNLFTKGVKKATAGALGDDLRMRLKGENASGSLKGQSDILS